MVSFYCWYMTVINVPVRSKSADGRHCNVGKHLYLLSKETLDVLFAAFSRDTPRKRAGAASVAGATNRCSAAAGGSSADLQLEEVDGNFPVSRQTEFLFLIYACFSHGENKEFNTDL